MALAPDTQGRRQLSEWLSQKGRSANKLATVLGVSQPAVRAWVERMARPKQDLREALGMICGIPASDWETEKERESRIAAKREIKKRAATLTEPADDPAPASTAEPKEQAS